MNKNSALNIILSSTVTIVFVIFLTITAELFPPVKTWLTQNFSHHWIGKSILSVLVFVVLTGVFHVLKLKGPELKTSVWALIIAANLGFVLLLLFFLLESF